MVAADQRLTQRARPVVLHPLVVRITHWLNALAIFITIGSGWRIYNWEPLFGFEFPVWMTFRVQGWLFNPNRLEPTYPESAVDRVFRYNAFYPEEQAPQLDPATYRLELSGAIGDKRPWTVDKLYELPRTSPITRHVCVERWSRIGKWSGCPREDYGYNWFSGS